LHELQKDMMKQLLSVLSVLLISGSQLFAQTGALYLLKDHEVVINGKTNVNKFSCKLKMSDLKDTLSIKVTHAYNRIDFQGLALRLPINEFDCGNPIMNADLRKLLQADEYPELVLEMKRIEFGPPSKGGYDDSYIINTLITIAEVRKTEVFRNSGIEEDDKHIRFYGKHNLFLTNYNIEPPQKFFGTIKVQNELEVEFEINLHGLSR
jgi:hypothetical protein